MSLGRRELVGAGLSAFESQSLPGSGAEHIQASTRGGSALYLYNVFDRLIRFPSLNPSQARKELDLYRRKSREMEQLISVVQRAWAQLDIDAGLVLDSLGDDQVHIDP